jgi:hypothetical protein
VRFPWQRKPAEAITPAQKAEIVRVFGAALQSAPKKPRRSPYAQELQPYEPFPGVVPMAEKRRAMAQDATPYSTINSVYGATDLFFPGYQVLAEMAQLPEYRKLSEIIAKEMTRKWIKLTTSGDEDKSDKIAALDAELKRLDVQALFRRCAELDGFFGRGQLYIDVCPSLSLSIHLYFSLSPPLLILDIISSLAIVYPHLSNLDSELGKKILDVVGKYR